MIDFSYLDYIFFFLPFIIIFCILYFSQSKNKQSLTAYFQAEGKLSWFVAGTAMVATTFAADTPLAVTEIVRSNGISGNWLWWYMAIGGLVTVFFFAKLWKRSGATTDLQFIDIRYSGKEAQFLRSFKSILIGGILNLIILGWVNLAMLKIIQVFFPNYSDIQILLFLLVAGIIYTAIGGLRGISNIDVFQFFLAWGGCIVYAYCIINLPQIGGLDGLVTKIPKESLNFYPNFSNEKGLPYDHFIIMLTVIWWSSWYPGSEPGGGGYIAQRILSTKDEAAAMKSSLWFVLAHYFLRPWPWILVALSSLIVFPNLTEGESGKGFLLFLNEGLPIGIKGIILSAFLAAYLSTLATHLNWGASYIVFDFWKPTLQKLKSDSYYLKISYLVQLVTGISSLLIAVYGMETVKGAWVFLLEASSGIGFVLIARWFYWRISATTEILAIILSPLCYVIYAIVLEMKFPYTILATSLTCTIILIISTFIFPPSNKGVLIEFYNKVKPPHFFWKGLFDSQNIPMEKFNNQLVVSLFGVIFGFSLIISGLESIQGLLWNTKILFYSLPIMAVSLFFLGYCVRKKLNKNLVP
ncbi:MAG: sodium:solute symporter family protein [Leptospira sp.]|nr:sodium:solute symporter family protein [Leptospira sp.]